MYSNPVFKKHSRGLNVYFCHS